MKRREFLVSGLAILATPAAVLAKEEKSAATGSLMTAQEAVELLRLHNEARAKVGVAPLKWSAKIAAEAQEWANHLASTGQFEHQRSRYGENLAGGNSVRQAVEMWLSEKADFEAGAGFTKTGHYTQIVWRDTKFVGCGRAKGQDFEIFVAYYDPPGNMGGEKPY